MRRWELPSHSLCWTLGTFAAVHNPVSMNDGINGQVDRTSTAYVSRVYSCPRSTCKGVKSSAAFSKCWDRDDIEETYTATSVTRGGECDTDDLQCYEGATGPLCG